MSVGPRAILSWRDAELACAEWMAVNGWPDAQVGPGRADSGLDVVASKAVAQVKWQDKPVGRPTVQNLIGAARGAHALLFSRAGFTDAAIAWARQDGVDLIQFDSHGNFEVVVGSVAALAIGSSSGPLAGPVEAKFRQVNVRLAAVRREIQQTRLSNPGWLARQGLSVAEKELAKCEPLLERLVARYGRKQMLRAQLVADQLLKQIARTERALPRDARRRLQSGG